jgi:mono/diheme cytochrome c family protein
MLFRPPCLWLLLAVSLPASSLAAEPVDYARQVKPILRQHCFSCHGPIKQEGGLRLDAGRMIMQGGESGAALVTGKPSRSPLMERLLEEDPERRMPQQAEPLEAGQIDILRRWIAAGADFPKADSPAPDPRSHWSFQNPVRSPLPRGVPRDWRDHPVDRFIAAGHKEARVKPVSLAGPEQLLRRVYLDLVGVPPGRKELHQFLADPSAAAYRQVVDRLLEDPRYGERWGRHWMDVWRYSDWYGRRQVDDVRNSFPHIWRWRDWIIDSLNEDKGYDQMIREMLAADELYPADDDRIVATGFLVRNWFSLNYDTWMRDVVEHTGKAFLGLRMNCALCHDHKYDPITQEDYFRFRAFFEPLEVRNDRVPGGPRLEKYLRYKPGSGASLKPGPAGLARIYDFTLDATTRMYRLGDQRDLFTDRPPVQPGVPGFLGELPQPIAIIDLPAEAHYPGIKQFVQEAELKTRQQALAAATEKADEVRGQQQSTVDQAERTLKQREAALAELLKRPPPEASSLSSRGMLVKQAAAFWDFEPGEAEESFLEDRTGHGHRLSIKTEGSGRATLLAAGKWPVDSALHRLSGDTINTAAVLFEHGSGQAVLQAPSSAELLAGEFTATAVMRLDRSEPGLVQAILGSQGRWALVVEGVDERHGRLRFLSWDEKGNRLAVPVAGEAGALDVEVSREYFVAVVAGPGECQVLFRVLEADQPLVSSRGPVAMRMAAEGDKADLRIGDLDGSAWWHGLVDDVGFWTRALKVEELGVLAGTSGVDQAVVTARQEVQQARASLLAVTRPAKVAGLKREAAAAELEAIEARIRADNQRFRGPTGDQAATDKLGQEAARQEQRAAASTLEAAVAVAELAVAKLQSLAKQDDAIRKQLQAARATLDSTRKQFDQARELLKKPVGDYSLLSPTYPRQSSGRRRALAAWITDRQNPLAARVAVNHIWMRHFGRPLVESVMDLGVSGKQPTHPELLDWLAVELMERDWSMKHLHRLILTSRTYRLQTKQGASADANLVRDRDNRWWWKMDDRRMEAEMLRDSILAVSGELDMTRGGPEQDPAMADTIPRRSLYFSIYPEGGGQIAMLGLFDPPDPCDCYRRSSSVLPQQSLAMVNSRLVLDQGRLLARRLAEEIAPGGIPVDDLRFVQAAFEQVLSRRPRQAETAACLSFLEKQALLFSKDDLATDVTPEGRVAPSKDPAMRARESLVRALFSHNDFITIH